MKKTAAIFLAVLMLVIMAMPMSASAVVVSLEDGLSLNPGNTRNPNPDYNFAWLDQLFVRTDAMEVAPSKLTPTPTDNPYSHTYEEYLKECDRYISLYSLDGKSVESVYSALVEAVYYTVTAAGMTDNFDAMCATLTRNGIELPDEATAEDKMKIGIVYASIEFNAIYTIYEKQTELPAGITLDEAYTIIIGSLAGVSVPSGVDSMSGLALQAVKQFLGDYAYIPLSDNPSAEELFYFLKVVIITEDGDNIPLTKYNKVTAADKEYVDYKYFATVLSSAYDVEIDYEALYYASQNEEDKYAVHRLVLETMLNEKGVAYSERASTEKLFNLACKNGYFALEQEFFSDILSYRLEVAPSCEKIWFTPITIGDQLNGGNKEPISIYLQGQYMEPGATAAASLDTEKSEETIFLEVNYKQDSKHDIALYEFLIVKNPALEDEKQPSDVLGQVQGFVNDLIPSDNEKASEIVESVFSGIGAESTATSSGQNYIEDILSTYGSSSTTEGSADTKTTTGTDYLGQLLEGMYETDADGNIITTKTYTVTTEADEDDGEGFLQQVTQTVAENPEIVAAPTSLIALGGLLGFMMNKKHKDSLRLTDESEEENESE
ncbi:MAG: hypothetical protein IJO73_08495 [Clostridia bacterium]|nr:hypothetical protein [Clostridia bacterium]